VGLGERLRSSIIGFKRKGGSPEKWTGEVGKQGQEQENTAQGEAFG
jgi:hypothetical protein